MTTRKFIMNRSFQVLYQKSPYLFDPKKSLATIQIWSDYGDFPDVRGNQAGHDL